MICVWREQHVLAALAETVRCNNKSQSLNKWNRLYDSCPAHQSPRLRNIHEEPRCQQEHRSDKKGWMNEWMNECSFLLCLCSNMEKLTIMNYLKKFGHFGKAHHALCHKLFIKSKIHKNSKNSNVVFFLFQGSLHLSSSILISLFIVLLFWI